MDAAGQEQTLHSEGTKRKISDDFELARQKALEVAARLNSAAESKRPRFDSPVAASDGALSNSSVSQPSFPVFTASTGQYNGSQGTSKKIHIPNGKVGVIIGRGGDMIKNLQQRSGARIQITRDTDADPTSMMRDVDLMGTPDQISRAEELINEVIAETEAAAPGGPSGNRPANPMHVGGEQFVMKVPNDKVALIIGKGGEAIKSMQSKSGARIQVVPLRLPPGDPSTERSVYISGTQEQIDSAKELVNDVMSGNRLKAYSGSAGYTQSAYPQTGGWAQSQPPMQQQQAAYGYGQQAGYGAPQPYYGGYPPQQQASWDQTNPSTVPPQPQQTTGYNPYGQQQQVQPTSAPPNAGYNYGQAPATSTYNYNQGYAQQPPSYGQDTTQPPQAAADQRKSYGNPNPYGQPPPASQPDGSTPSQPSQPSYGAPAPDAGTQPSPAYATGGYTQPATSAPTNGYGTYPGYGAPPSYDQAAYAQMGYGQQQGVPGQAQPQASYPYYGQGGYPPAQASYYQGGYPAAPGQPPAQGHSAGGAAPGQPPAQGHSAGGAAQPPGADGNSAGGPAAATQEAE